MMVVTIMKINIYYVFYKACIMLSDLFVLIY